MLAQRQQKEKDELIERFEEEKKTSVDEVLAEMQAAQSAERRKLTDMHSAQLAALSPDDEEGRAELLNRHLQELMEFDKNAAAELSSASQELLLEWETRRSDALLDLRKRHLQELAKHAREANIPSAKEEAEKNLRDLDSLRYQLEQDRERALGELEEQQAMFEQEQAQKMRGEIAAFESSLVAEREKEAERQRKLMLGLGARKVELLAEAEKRKEEKLRALREKGASPEETQQLINQHTEEVQRLTNKLDADKLRQQQKLQEQLEKRRRKKKAQGIHQIKEKNAQQISEKESEMKLKLADLHSKSASRIEKAISGDVKKQSSVSPAKPGLLTPDDAMEMAVPLSESQLQDILSNSPLSSKLQGIADLLTRTQEGSYMDAINSQHQSDTELLPVDLNLLSPQDFVVYKFGCYMCQVAEAGLGTGGPVTLLLASSIPPNPELKQNAYRNMFYYDPHNRHLYLRLDLLSDVGSFTTVLVHCVSHVRVGEMGNDNEPAFQESLYTTISRCSRELYNQRERAGYPHPALQDLLEMNLVGTDSLTQHQVSTRLAGYKEVALVSALAKHRDSEDHTTRGTTAKLYTATGNGQEQQSNSRYTPRLNSNLSLLDLENEEDSLNLEFGTVCDELLKTSENIGVVESELASQNSVSRKEETSHKLGILRERLGVLRGKQTEISRKIKEISVEIKSRRLAKN